MFMISHFHYDPVWWNTQAAYTETWGAAIQYRTPFQEPGSRSSSPTSTWPAATRLQVRARRARLPQAVLGRLSGGSRIHPPAPCRRSARVRGRDVQRAEHQPHQRRDRRSATRSTGSATSATSSAVRRRPPGSSTRSVTTRSSPGSWPTPASPRARGRAGRSTSGARTGSAVPAACPSPSWPRASTRGCSSRWSSIGSRRAGAPCSPASWPITTRRAGGWMPHPRSRRPRRRSTACSPSCHRWPRRRTSCCPVGTDYTPPNKWLTAIHRDWNRRYVWPKFIGGHPARVLRRGP